jgi:hypothetical protein
VQKTEANKANMLPVCGKLTLVPIPLFSQCAHQYTSTVMRSFELDMALLCYEFEGVRPMLPNTFKGLVNSRKGEVWGRRESIEHVVGCSVNDGVDRIIRDFSRCTLVPNMTPFAECHR